MRYVKEIAERNVVALSDSQSIGDFIREFRAEKIDYIAVKSRGTIKGIITLRHIIGHSSSRLLEDCLITPVETIPWKIYTKDALKLMNAKKIELLLLMDDNKESVSVVTRDMLRFSLLNDNELSKLYDEKREYEFMVNNLKELITTINGQYIYTGANAAYCKAHDKTREEIVGKTVTDILGKDVFEEKIKKYLVRAFEGEEVHYTKNFQFGNIGQRYYDVTYYPYKGKDNRVNQIVAVTRDITEQDKLRKKMLQQSKLAGIGRLAAGVAHELNNPLTSVIAMSDLLCLTLESRLKKAERNNLDLIKKAGLRMKNIIDRLLAFSRPHGRESKKKVNVYSIIKSVRKMFDAELKKENIAVVLNISRVPNICGVSEYFMEIFINLFANSIDALKNRRNKEIHIGAEYRPKKGLLTIKFRDNGKGIEKDMVQKIFDPFFTNKESDKGTGLGLAIVYDILKKYNGDIEVESEAGGFTEFSISFSVDKKGRHIIPMRKLKKNVCKILKK